MTFMIIIVILNIKTRVIWHAFRHENVKSCMSKNEGSCFGKLKRHLVLMRRVTLIVINIASSERHCPWTFLWSIKWHCVVWLIFSLQFWKGFPRVILCLLYLFWLFLIVVYIYFWVKLNMVSKPSLITMIKESI